LSYRGAWTY